VLCLPSAHGHNIKKSYYSVAPPSSRGCIDIVGRSKAVLGSRGNTDVDVALRYLSVGDEVAVKAGPHRLRLPEIGDQIQRIVAVASGEGILPAVQLMRALCADQDTTVADVDVLWINDNRSDFLLNHEVEKLQQQQEVQAGPRLRVTRIVDRELGNADALLNADLHGAVPGHRQGAVGLVLAEGVAAEKCHNLLISRGYPENAIAQLT
jgi:NAD(P)H-flavin reductase